MEEAPLPDNEETRLKALADYRLLDTQSEQAYDDITELLAHICDCPITLIGLIDDKRQWFKSKVGLDSTETPRDKTFCAHALLRPNQMMVVSDALADARFANNPLVLDGPRIRFYAGMPLNTPEGLPLGTLCMIDAKPRKLTGDQARVLQILARQVTHLFELRRASQQLAEALEEVKVLKSILPTCSHCKAIRDEEGAWHSLEAYLDTRANVGLSHSICPDCMKKHYPNYRAAQGKS